LTALLLALQAYVLAPETAPPNITVVRQAELLRAGASPQLVALQHIIPNVPGQAHTATYRVQLPGALNRQVPLGMYINNIRQHLSVDINSVQWFTSRHANTPHSTSNRAPQLIALPHPIPADNQFVDINVFTAPSNTLVMSSVWIGALDDVGPIFDKRHLVRVFGVRFMTTLLAILAVVSLCFWLYDRDFLALLWFGLFAITNSLFLWTGFVTTAPILPFTIHHHFNTFYLSCWVAALVQFSLEMTKTRTCVKDWLLMGFVILSALLAFALFEESVPYARYTFVIQILALCLGIYIQWVLALAWWQQRDTTSGVLFIGTLLTVLTSALAVFANWTFSTTMDIYNAAYIPVPLIFAMVWAIGRRYARIRLRTLALNRHLSKRVAAREKEISQAYERVREMQRDEAIAMERDRFTRDMHDGLGAQLIASLKMAQRGNLNVQNMKEILQECLDELRFSIESLKPTADDFLTVLGNYRYRLQPRLEAAGVDLKWRFDDVPGHCLSPHAILQTLRILNEAVSNVLKHARSNRLDITGALELGSYTIWVRDYGSGLTAPQHPTGEGLRNMALRAQHMQATLRVEFTPTGTTVHLVLPLPG
jgi:signal transduction histidine kinase